MKLSTDKIRLISIEPSHWPCIYAWSSSDGYEYFFGNSGPFSGAECQQFNASGLNLMIVNPANVREIYGMISVSNIDDRSRNFHYNILIDKNYQRKGFAKDSLKLSLFYLFNNLNYYKAIALIGDSNIESRELAELIGFEHEATLKQEVYLNGEFEDVNRYRMFKGIFNKLYKKDMENTLAA